MHGGRKEGGTHIVLILSASFAPIKHDPTGNARGDGLFSDYFLFEGQINDASMKIYPCGGLNNLLLYSGSVCLFRF